MALWWDENFDLLLLSLQEFEEISDGETLTAIDGEVVVKGVDKIDLDTRDGHIAYGVTGNHPLRVAKLEAMARKPKSETVPQSNIPEHIAWSCKIGMMGNHPLPPGSDLPMRRAVEKAYEELTGFHCEFNFSGWGTKLDPIEYETI